MIIQTKFYKFYFIKYSTDIRKVYPMKDHLGMRTVLKTSERGMCN